MPYRNCAAVTQAPIAVPIWLVRCHRTPANRIVMSQKCQSLERRRRCLIRWSSRRHCGKPPTRLSPRLTRRRRSSWRSMSGTTPWSLSGSRRPSGPAGNSLPSWRNCGRGSRSGVGSSRSANSCARGCGSIGSTFDALRRIFRRGVDEWRIAASRIVAQGRQVIRKLLGANRVVMTPREDGTVELSGRADYGKLFSGLVVATALASPTGFDKMDKLSGTLRGLFARAA